MDSLKTTKTTETTDTIETSETITCAEQPASNSNEESTGEPKFVRYGIHRQGFFAQERLAPWWNALKNVLPIYISVHLAFIVITCLSALFVIPDFSWRALPLNTLWLSWNRWDSIHYVYLATHGYTDWWRTAFFPLLPVLERVGGWITRDPFIAGLIISNAAGLGMLVVLYRLVEEDFDAERAFRTSLYLSLFPVAFFFAAAYTESLFLFLALLSFYSMRHGQWWLAGLFGFFATLTRSAGILLLLPFAYEYLRQNQFQLRAVRLNVLGGGLIAAGMLVFMAYSYHRFHLIFPFTKAEEYMWSRYLHSPWFIIHNEITGLAQSNGFLSFHALRNLIDIGQILLIFATLIFSLIGPWRFPRHLWAYTIYLVIFFVVLQLYPVKVNPARGPFPLQDFPRYMLEVFPAFIVLAGIGGRCKTLHLSYLMISGAVLFVLLSLYLTGHWVV